MRRPFMSICKHWSIEIFEVLRVSAARRVVTAAALHRSRKLFSPRMLTVKSSESPVKGAGT